MASKLAQIKTVVLELLSDGMEHTTNEIRNRINEEGIELDKKSSTLRTAIYQLRNNGTNIYSKDRGIYQIKELDKKENSSILNGFITLMPEEKTSQKKIYIHSNGYLVLNGKLNKEIKTRQIEIKISGDGKKIALIPDGKNSHKFTKNGSTKNTNLLKLLKNKHISVPAIYEMEEDKYTEIWIGQICKNPRIKK